LLRTAITIHDSECSTHTNSWLTWRTATNAPALQATFALFQDILPIRFGGFMLLRQPRYISVVLALVKPFLNKKLRQRIYLLGDDWEQMHSIVDPSQLPASFGGTLDYEPTRVVLEEALPDWERHVSSWHDLGISAAHVTCAQTDRDGRAILVAEGMMPPYQGTAKIRAKLVTRRAAHPPKVHPGPEPEPEPEV
jgi:hypothetical protein